MILFIRLRPTPNGDGYASFDFKVTDDGGTTPGVDTSLDAVTMTINVDSVNDAPVAVPSHVDLTEGGSHTFAASEFGFSDPSDLGTTAGADSLASITITSLP